MVKVVFSSILLRLTNQEKTVTLSASTLLEALNQLIQRYGIDFKERVFKPTGEPTNALNFFLNGKNVRFLDSIDTSINDADELLILPRASGG